VSWILGYLLIGFVIYFAASEMFADDPRVGMASWCWNLASIVAWPVVLVWGFFDGLDLHLRKGGVNPAPENFHRPDPPPAFKPGHDRSDR
jgi:hypothetical protein